MDAVMRAAVERLPAEQFREKGKYVGICGQGPRPIPSLRNGWWRRASSRSL